MSELSLCPSSCSVLLALVTTLFLGFSIPWFASRSGLSCVDYKRQVEVLTLVPVSVAFFGRMIFAEAIRLRQGYTGSGWALVWYDWCPYKKRIRIQTSTKGDGHVMTEVETGVTCHNPRKAWGYQNLEETRAGPPFETLEIAWSCWFLEFGLLASRTLRG